MELTPWTKPNLVSLTGTADSEAGKYYDNVVENAMYSPSGVGTPV